MANSQLPYLQRVNYGGLESGGDFASDLRSSFGYLTDQVNNVMMNRAVNSASEQLQNLQLSEASDSEKRKTQNELAFQLGNEAMRRGYMPGYAQALQTRFQAPKSEAPHVPQNLAQLSYLAAQEKQRGGNTYNPALDIYKKTQGELAQNKADAKGPKEEDPLKNLYKEQAVFSKFSNDISPDRQRSGALADQVRTLNKAQNLIQLIGPNTKVSDLDQVSRQFVAESATALASMVKNGQVTEAEIHNFMPDTIGMKGAKLQEFVSNGPAGANVGQFLKLYLSSAKRESSLGAQTIAESILSKAQGNSALSKINPDRFKQEVATALNTHAQKSLSADDILIDKRGKVTTTEQQAMDDKFKLYNNALGEAKMKINSKDKAQADKARLFFEKLGLDPEDNVPEMRTLLKTRIRAGAIQ